MAQDPRGVQDQQSTSTFAAQAKKTCLKPTTDFSQQPAPPHRGSRSSNSGPHQTTTPAPAGPNEGQRPPNVGRKGPPTHSNNMSKSS